MLKIRFQRSQADGLTGFEAKGHAEYADAGEDIVCAAASAILQAAALGLTELIAVKPRLVIKPGLMICECPRYANEAERLKAQAIVETALLGCRNLAYQYPNHIQIHEGGGSHAVD